MAVDFIDSKLSGDENRNAIIKACQNDFAVVGNGALFMNNVDDLVACPDQGARRPVCRCAGGDALGGTAGVAGVVRITARRRCSLTVG